MGVTSLCVVGCKLGTPVSLVPFDSQTFQKEVGDVLTGILHWLAPGQPQNGPQKLSEGNSSFSSQLLILLHDQTSILSLAEASRLLAWRDLEGFWHHEKFSNLPHMRDEGVIALKSLGTTGPM